MQNNHDHDSEKEILQQRAQEARQELSYVSVKSLELLKQGLSLANWVRSYPLQTLGAAAVVGWIVASKAIGSAPQTQAAVGTASQIARSGLGQIFKNILSAVIVSKVKQELNRRQHHNEGYLNAGSHFEEEGDEESGPSFH